MLDEWRFTCTSFFEVVLISSFVGAVFFAEELRASIKCLMPPKPTISSSATVEENLSISLQGTFMEATALLHMFINSLCDTTMLEDAVGKALSAR